MVVFAKNGVMKERVYGGSWKRAMTKSKEWEKERERDEAGDSSIAGG